MEVPSPRTGLEVRSARDPRPGSGLSQLRIPHRSARRVLGVARCVGLARRGNGTAQQSASGSERMNIVERIDELQRQWVGANSEGRVGSAMMYSADIGGELHS